MTVHTNTPVPDPPPSSVDEISDELEADHGMTPEVADAVAQAAVEEVEAHTTPVEQPPAQHIVVDVADATAQVAEILQGGPAELNDIAERLTGERPFAERPEPVTSRDLTGEIGTATLVPAEGVDADHYVARRPDGSHLTEQSGARRRFETADEATAALAEEATRP